MDKEEMLNLKEGKLGETSKQKEDQNVKYKFLHSSNVSLKWHVSALLRVFKNMLQVSLFAICQKHT